ncbi:hypothetical protein BU23DRAFT_654732, partial [Bimuria novae-zelandiae CBS 107.79]
TAPRQKFADTFAPPNFQPNPPPSTPTPHQPPILKRLFDLYIMRRPLAEISGNRKAGFKLSLQAHSAILAQVENRVPKAKIARTFNVSRQAVYDTIKR